MGRDTETVEKSALMAQLKSLQQQAQEAELVIRDQNGAIERFERMGHDVLEARRMLANYELMQQIRLGKIDEILDQLDTVKA